MAASDRHDGPGLTFGVLGAMEVSRDGQRLSLGGRQQRAVLALLLADVDRALSAGRIADALWQEVAHSGSVATIQTYVFHLREILEPDHARGEPWSVLVTAPDGYRLELDGSLVDARTFERLVDEGRAAAAAGLHAEAVDLLTQGIALWRGEVLADLADFPFVEAWAGRLTAARVEAFELRAQSRLELGQHAELVGELDRLVAEHPLREQLHAQRILALYRCGRQSEALAAYRELHRVLDEELGVEPSAPLRQLNQAVLVQDPALDWVAPAPIAPSTLTSDPAAPEVSTMVPAVSAEPPSFGRRLWLGVQRHRRITAVATVLVLCAGIAIVVDRSRHQTASALEADSVGSIDEHGGLGPSIHVGANPDAITYGDGAVWVASRTEDAVYKIDPHSGRRVEQINVGRSPAALAVGGQDLWVANFADRTVDRFSTVTFKPLGTIHVGNQPIALAADRQGVWVANYADDTIQHIDRVSRSAGPAIAVGHGPDALAVEGDSVWIAAALDNTVSELNARTKTLLAPILVPSGPREIALTSSDVWVTNQSAQAVTRINRRSRLAQAISVGDGPHSIQVLRRAAWVTNEYDGTVTRIDTADNSTRTIRVGSSPRGLTVARDRIWVATASFADQRHQGGTLHVVGTTIPGGPGAIDPAVVYDFQTGIALVWVYDGLLAMRRAGGLAAQTVVPDLAESMPSPTNGNRTYSFRLRSGIRYSTGALVQASDFRRGLIRALTIGANPRLYENIVGADACIRRATACDLSQGVGTDDATREVTFNLVKPDPELLYKLTLFVFPMPAGVPLTESTTPLPGTGPYQISRYVPRKDFQLTRNRFFHQWSFAAQPAAYPSIVDFDRVSSPEEAVRQVRAGLADVADVFDLPRDQVDQLRDGYPNRYFSQIMAQSGFAFLNTSKPPFDDARVRQAFNFAVDRDTLTEIQGGAGAVGLSCQVLPPSFPSYKPYCPYTVGPHDGEYRGPDVAVAQSLIRASGGVTAPVTLGGGTDRTDRAITAYLAGVLRGLGMHVSVRNTEDPAPTLSAYGSRTFGWIADFPQAGNFYDNLFACNSPAFLTTAHCNDGIAAVAARAHAEELADPTAAGADWTQVDQMLTREATFVALGNLSLSVFVSARVGNVQSNPSIGALFSQMWVK